MHHFIKVLTSNPLKYKMDNSILEGLDGGGGGLIFTIH